MKFIEWFKQSDYGKPSYERPNMAMPEDVAKEAFIAGLQRAAEICDKSYEQGFAGRFHGYVFAAIILKGIEGIEH